MSRWGRWDYDFPKAAPKKPPPERGIRMKKAGTTWWGQRWIEALENVLRGDSGRLARGRTYARGGRTHDLVVKAGQVTAKVTGSRATPYKITIRLIALSDAAWGKAIAGLAKKAQFSAELLAGQMPQAIDEVFVEAGVSLFPNQRSDLQTACSCPDWGDPCKHVAATHYVLGEALDRDPFLLFELRGRTKDQVLDALRAARGGETTAKKSKSAPQPADAPALPTVKLGQLTAAEYDKPRVPLPALSFSFEAPATHGAVLRQLGAPTAWASDTSPADVLAPLVRAAAEAARRIAMAEPSDTDNADHPVAAPTPKTPSAKKPSAKKPSAKKRPTAKSR
jgi:uncharacterized Zn finger protein